MINYKNRYGKALTGFGFTVLTGLLSVSASLAQEAGDHSERQIIVGVGVQLQPKYPGSDSEDFLPLVFFVRHKNGDPLPVRTPDESAGFRLLGDDRGFSAGPVIGFESKRDENDVGIPVGNVGLTLEPGIFLQTAIGQNARVRMEVRHGIGGHDAFTGDISADYIIRPTDDRFVATIGPRVRLADARFQRSYFGVDNTQSLATGIAPYDPDGGIYALGAASSVMYQLSPRLGLYGYVGYDRLLQDAGDSPLVLRYGSRDQLSAALALTFRFNR